MCVNRCMCFLCQMQLSWLTAATQHHVPDGGMMQRLERYKNGKSESNDKWKPVNGMRVYLCAGTRNLAWSKYLLPSESERRLPTLAGTNHQGSSLKGTVRPTSAWGALRTGGCIMMVAKGHAVPIVTQSQEKECGQPSSY